MSCMRFIILCLTISLTLQSEIIFCQTNNTFCCETEQVQDILEIIKLPKSERAKVLPQLCYDNGISKSHNGNKYLEFSKFCGLNEKKDPKRFSTFRFWEDGVTTYIFSEGMFWSFYIQQVKSKAKALDETNKIFADSNFIYKFSKLPAADNKFTFQLDIESLKTNNKSDIQVRDVSGVFKLPPPELILSVNCTGFEWYEKWAKNKDFSKYTNG